MELNDREYAATVDKIAKLNERAARRGWTGRITITREQREVKEITEAGFETVRVVNDVTISGEPPKYEGWTFLASLDFDPEAGVIVSTAPGVGTVHRRGLKDGHRPHCNTAR